MSHPSAERSGLFEFLSWVGMVGNLAGTQYPGTYPSQKQNENYNVEILGQISQFSKKIFQCLKDFQS